MGSSNHASNNKPHHQSMRSFFSKIRESALFPFEKGTNLFVLLLLLSISINVPFLYLRGYLYDSYLYFVGGIVSSYLIVFIGGFLSSKIFKWYGKCWVALGLVSITIDVFLTTKMNTANFFGYSEIVLNSNREEVKEFFNSMIDHSIVIKELIVIFIIAIVYYILNIIEIHLHNIMKYLLLSFVFYGLYTSYHNRSAVLGTIPLKYISLLLVPKPVDLSKHLNCPDISIHHSLPHNLVIIIGESFSKSHSSLYGYPLKTNPCVEKLKKDGQLFVFNNVEAAATRTLESFKLFMSTYDDDGELEWYEGVTIPEMLNKIGYHTVWISNQEQNGFYGNIITCYASLCKKLLFTNKKENSFDEDVIPIIKDNLTDNDSCKCFFVHLVGSHEDFTKRYPLSRNHFKETDSFYRKYHSPMARRVMTAYDNSVLYNDSVVSETISLFKEREAIVIYFPDHGLDLFESSGDYVGHARPTDEESLEFGRKIPFVIWVSEKFSQEFPDVISKIERSLNNNFNTSDLIYTIMALIDCEFTGQNTRKYSLIR